MNVGDNDLLSLPALGHRGHIPTTFWTMPVPQIFIQIHEIQNPLSPLFIDKCRKGSGECVLDAAQGHGIST